MSQTPGSPSPGSAAAGDDGRIPMEWELGLPLTSDLTPLSHSLISQTLAAAFNISPEPSRSAADLNRASHSTLLNLQNTANRNPNPNSSFPNFNNVDEKDHDDNDVEEIEDERSEKGVVVVEEDEEEEKGGRRGRRLVWTPQLHKRFVDVVGHIGIKNAVPKTIMQMMNVEGLTRENVASHLQKYRLYLKRMQVLSPRRTSEGGDQQEGSSSSQRGGGGMGQGNVTGMMMPVMPMMMGMGGYGGGQQQQQLRQYHHQYGVMQQSAWNGYHHVGSNEK